MNFVYYFHDEFSIDSFEKKLLFFLKQYNIISCQDMLNYFAGKIQLKNSCMLTVDDGWLSTYNVIFPVIKKYNIPITIFVSPKICEEESNFWYYKLRFCNHNQIKEYLVQHGYFSSSIQKYPLGIVLKELNVDIINKVIDENLIKNRLDKLARGFINVRELLEMSESGLVEIGAHTLTHPILANEDCDRSYSEIRDSIDRLSLLLGRSIRTFAYPNGISNLDFGNREIEYLCKCGIKLAFSVDSDSFSKKTDMLSIPRIGSQKRLLLGRLGVKLPSLSGQAKNRKQISVYKKDY